MLLWCASIEPCPESLLGTFCCLQKRLKAGDPYFANWPWANIYNGSVGLGPRQNPSLVATSKSPDESFLAGQPSLVEKEWPPLLPGMNALR